MVNILILSPFFPWPLLQGGKIRIFNIIRCLSQRDYKITLACLSDAKITDFGPLNDFCDEIICIERRQDLVRDLAVFLIGKRPFNFVRFSSEAFRDVLRQLLTRKSFDLVQIEFSQMWQYADIFGGIPSVLDAHNIESEIISQIGKTQRNPLRKFLYKLEEKKFRRSEEKAWRECDLCFAVSEKERGVIALHNRKVFTVPNGVDCSRFEFMPRKEVSKNILFIGGADYIPNRDAALYLLEEIFPLLRAAEPDARLNIVGRTLGPLQRRHAAENVSFYENVPDILPCFREADVLVVPLRRGAGTRIKILEAMAAGLSVVTTSKGCEGLDTEDGEHLMVADNPYAFAGRVLKILDDPVLRSAIIHNGRKLVETKYSWGSLVRGMECAYDTLSEQILE